MSYLKFSNHNDSILRTHECFSALFSNTVSLRYSLNVGDKISHQYKTTDKIIILYVLIFFLFRQQTRRQNVLN
jgi:hypothetical protein